MTRFVRALALSFLALLLGAVPAHGASTDIPAKPNSWMLDLAGVMTAAGRDQVEADLESFSQRTGKQMAVLIVKTTGDNSIEDFGADTANRWGIGQKGEDNGVLLTVAMEDRKARIDVGYGNEGGLTDSQAKRILDDQLFPNLRNGDVDAGIKATETAVRSALGDTEAAVPPPTGDSGSSAPAWVTIVVIMVIVVIIFLSSIFGGKGGRRRGSSFGSNLGWGAVGYGLGGGFGGGHSGGSSGGGFGGFSGGSFGGGGASGSW